MVTFPKENIYSKHKASVVVVAFVAWRVLWPNPTQYDGDGDGGGC